MGYRVIAGKLDDTFVARQTPVHRERKALEHALTAQLDKHVCHSAALVVPPLRAHVVKLGPVRYKRFKTFVQPRSGRTVLQKRQRGTCFDLHHMVQNRI